MLTTERARRYGTWYPQYVETQDGSVSSSTQVLRVETDLGRGFLKAMGNPEGPHALASEWIGTCLASELGLPVFPFGLVTVTNDPFPLRFNLGLDGVIPGTVATGPAFITSEVVGDVWHGDPATLATVSNREDITRLVVFDTWIRNRDRYCHTLDGRIRPNLRNVFFSHDGPSPNGCRIRAFDFSACFSDGGTLGRDVSDIDRVRDSRLFSLFPQFIQYIDRPVAEEFLDRIGSLSRPEIAAIVESVPSAWELDSRSGAAIVEMLMLRIGFLRQTILTSICAVQRPLFEEGDAT